MTPSRMRHARRGIALAGFAVALLLACSTRPAGLELIIATDLNAPDDYDTLQLHVSQEGTTVRDDPAFTEPGTVTLPATFAIAAGSLADQEAIIDVSLLKAGALVVERQAQVQVPKDRVAELTLVLGRKCVGVMCEAGTTCDPQPDAGSGACVSVIVDPVMLPTFTPGDVDAAAAVANGEEAGVGEPADAVADSTLGSGSSSSGSSSSGSSSSGSSSSGSSSSGSSSSGSSSSGSSSGSSSSGGSGSNGGGSGHDASMDAPTVAADSTIDGIAVIPDATSEPDAPPDSGDSTLIAYYPFDESTGTTSADATGNGHTAMMQGATFSAGIQGNAATMNGTTQYVILPAGIVSGLTSFSISAWFYLSDKTLNSRVFDFNSGTTDYMFLTPEQMRFAISTNGFGVEQQIVGPTIPTAVWQHVAVTLSGTTGTLYVNGVAQTPNTNMTLQPASLGTTTNDWLGRSSYAGDPYLNGKIDNFRIYSRELSAAEVQSLFTQKM